MSGTIETLAQTPHLLAALDFDGTLSPLVLEPMTARMAPEARVAVEALASAPDTTVAFVSGRSLADLRVIAEHTDDSPIYLAGSHGAQFWIPGEGDQEPEVAADDIALRDRLRSEAEAAVAPLGGVWIEPKAFGFGVHTRGLDPRIAQQANERVDEIMAREAPQWRRRTGHNIVEFAFRVEGKDAAVARLRELSGASAVLFAGDDLTDEDAITSLGADDLGIRVGEGATAATLRVANITELAGVLSQLAQLRRAARQ